MWIHICCYTFAVSHLLLHTCYTLRTTSLCGEMCKLFGSTAHIGPWYEIIFVIFPVNEMHIIRLENISESPTSFGMRSSIGWNVSRAVLSLLSSKMLFQAAPNYQFSWISSILWVHSCRGRCTHVIWPIGIACFETFQHLGVQREFSFLSLWKSRGFQQSCQCWVEASPIVGKQIETPGHPRLDQLPFWDWPEMCFPRNVSTPTRNGLEPVFQHPSGHGSSEQRLPVGGTLPQSWHDRHLANVFLRHSRPVPAASALFGQRAVG